MTQRVKVELIDDIDGTPATQTLAFSFEGIHYRIDLNESHADELRAALAPWVEAGTRQFVRRRRGGGSGRNGAPVSVPVSQVRQWAKDNGYKVSDRGRVAANIWNAYADAHQPTTGTT